MGGRAPERLLTAEPFPAAYRVDQIVLQPRDPRWIHAYWELLPETVSHGWAELGKEGAASRMILRVCEEESGRWFDIDLKVDARDWTIAVEPPDRGWTVEIGLRAPSGRFLALARSNTVRTPPDHPSDRIVEDWGLLEGLPQGRSGTYSSLMWPRG
ncbi:MAG: DUF4912 domain-containing protein [Candidatus Omnitrophica bacterium]|nr:DUF4912 domain-containing protein [Candidatus Omnitrophota bacterium]